MSNILNFFLILLCQYELYPIFPALLAEAYLSREESVGISLLQSQYLAVNDINLYTGGCLTLVRLKSRMCSTISS